MTEPLHCLVGEHHTVGNTRRHGAHPAHLPGGRRPTSADLSRAELAAQIQETLGLLAAAHILVWSGSSMGAAALELRAAARVKAAATAEQLESLASGDDQELLSLLRMLRAIGAQSPANRPRAELFWRLRQAYDAADRMLPSPSEIMSGGEH